MTNDEAGRMAFGTVIGGLAAIALTKADLSVQSSVLRWIIYCVLAGIVVNTQQGIPLKRLVLAGLCSAVGLVVAILWMLALGRGSKIPLVISKVSLYGSPSGPATVDAMTAALFIAGILILSTFGVVVGGLARPAALDLVQRLGSVDVAKAQNIEKVLKIAASIIGVAALFVL
jgi:hypothetical protein